jgi:hypothetical protein
LASIALERMHVKAMAGSQDTGVAGAHAVGTTLAFSNGVPEGVVEIQHDLTSLARTMVAGTVGLEALIQLAEGLNALGARSVMPIAARTDALIPEIAPVVDAQTDPVSGQSNGTAYAQPARNASLPQTSVPSALVPQSPPLVAGIEQASPVTPHVLMPSLVTVGTDSSQDHWPRAPGMPATSASVAQISPGRTLSTATNPDAAAPVDRLPAMSASLTAARLEAVRNTELPSLALAPATVVPTPIAHAAVAPMNVAPMAARADDLPRTRSTLTFEATVAAARSQESLVIGSSAPSTASPTSQLASIPPLAAPRTEESGDQVMPTDVQRTPSMSRQSPDTAREPRQGLLILDGALLGRWIADRIARQVSRPVAGTTGIDPRISPTFPGAPASV